MADLIYRMDLMKNVRCRNKVDCEHCDFYTDGDSWCDGCIYGTTIMQTPAVDAVEVVRCRDCVHAVEIEKDYIRKLFVDGTKQCELGRADTFFGYSIISNDGFCDSGERKDDG